MSADSSSSSRGPSNKATQTPPAPCNTTTSGTQTTTPTSGSDDQPPNPIHHAASSTMLPLVLSPDYNCGQCASAAAAAATGSNDSNTTSPVRDSAASSEPIRAEPVQPQLSVGLWTKPETAEDHLTELEAQTQRSRAAVAAVRRLLEDLETEKRACLKLKEDVLELIEKAGEKTRTLESRMRELTGYRRDSGAK